MGRIEWMALRVRKLSRDLNHERKERDDMMSKMFDLVSLTVCDHHDDRTPIS